MRAMLFCIIRGAYNFVELRSIRESCKPGDHMPAIFSIRAQHHPPLIPIPAVIVRLFFKHRNTSLDASAREMRFDAVALLDR